MTNRTVSLSTGATSQIMRRGRDWFDAQTASTLRPIMRNAETSPQADQFVGQKHRVRFEKAVPVAESFRPRSNICLCLEISIDVSTHDGKQKNRFARINPLQTIHRKLRGDSIDTLQILQCV